MGTLVIPGSTLPARYLCEPAVIDATTAMVAKWSHWCVTSSTSQLKGAFGEGQDIFQLWIKDAGTNATSNRFLCGFFAHPGQIISVPLVRRLATEKSALKSAQLGKVPDSHARNEIKHHWILPDLILTSNRYNVLFLSKSFTFSRKP